MARKIRTGTLETRSARLRLAVSSQPLYVKIAVGLSLGYRRNRTDGSWVLRAVTGKGGYWTKNIGLADDYRDADGSEVLDFWQAQERARELARGEKSGMAADTAPITVSQALDAYVDDLKTRRRDPHNAARVRIHLPERFSNIPVAALRAKDLKKWRDGLARALAAATVNRILAPAKAAFNLAAKNDERIENRIAWETGFAALPDAEVSRNVILDDDQVRAIIAAAHAESRELGLLVETAAVTGARTSQLSRLDVVDLQDSPLPRLMVPTSRKGKGTKKITHQGVPLPPSLATQLRAAAAGRSPTAPLLVKPAPVPQHLPNGGRSEVIWTAERIAEVEALAAPRADGSTRSVAEIAAEVGVKSKGAITGLLYRLRHAKRPRPQALPARRSPQRWGKSEHNRPFARIVAAAGLDPTEVTIYALRHSSIARQLLAGVPVRLVAVSHDTSVGMIERTYSRYIGDHADHLLRAALIDPAAATSGSNVVPFEERR
jgi:hypothetical protein